MGRCRRLSSLLALVLVGCAQGGGSDDAAAYLPSPDAGALDAAPRFDAAPPPPDASSPSPDAGATDAGPPDAAPPDAGSDAAGPDAGAPDAGPPDAGLVCAGSAECEDGDDCTVDSCVGGMCTYTSAVTSGNACAAPIDVSAGGTFTGDSACASDDAAGACGAGDAPDVHFVFTLAESADVTIDSLGTSFDAVVGLGSSCVGGELGCDDDSAGAGQSRLVRAGLAAGTYYVTLDGKAGGLGGAWTLNVSIVTGPTTEDVAFPSSSGDTVVPSNGLFRFPTDFVQGSRSTTLPDVTGADVTVNIFNNDLGCAMTLGMAINGTAVGTFAVAPGASTATGSFGFAAIAGPTYTLRYERITSSVCGIAQVGPGGTVTLSR